jgi:hypothetical protein
MCTSDLKHSQQFNKLVLYKRTLHRGWTYFHQVMIIPLKALFILSFIFAIRPFFTQYSRRSLFIQHYKLPTVVKSSNEVMWL